MAALEQIRHPNVVGIYGHGVTPGGLPYLVMEFVEGRTLRDVLEDGPLSPATAAMLLRQIGSALAEIHSRGILHRDVTPDNLMIRGGCELVLIDFSIAIVKTPDEALHGKSRAAGTFAYMAPEQVMGGGLPASDIYSLARIVIEMLTGQRVADLPPGPATNLPVRVRELLSAVALAISQRSIDLLASALEYNPPLRPQSIQDFVPPLAEDLEAL